MTFFSDLTDLAVSLGNNIHGLNSIIIGMIFGPTSGYYFQYDLVKKNKSLGTFSIDVCAILIFSNVLRIFFW